MLEVLLLVERKEEVSGEDKVISEEAEQKSKNMG
jgi:hypothetical protein